MWNDRIERAAEAMRMNSSGMGLPRDIRMIMESAAEDRNIRVKDILSRSRHANVIAAKREVAHQLRECGMSYPQIGRILRMHYSSVMYYFEKHQPRPKVTPMPLKPATVTMRERIAALELLVSDLREQVRYLNVLALVPAAQSPQVLDTQAQSIPDALATLQREDSYRIQPGRTERTQKRAG